MTSRPLLVYGDMVDPELASNLLERPLSTATALLLDFTLLPLSRNAFPVLTASPGSSVAGVVFDDLSPRELARIDAYVGVAEGLYAREVGRAVGGSRSSDKFFEVDFYAPTAKTLDRGLRPGRHLA